MVGHFSLAADQLVITFRHMFIQPLAETMPHAVVMETLLLILYTIEQFTAEFKKLT